MAKINLKDMIEFASANAEKIFRKQGDFLPMWHAVTEDGDALILASPDFCENKDIGIAAVKEQFEKFKVDHYVFVSEAWLLEAQEDTDINKAMRAGLANHPDRREVLAFTAENSDGEMQTARRYILRPEHGRATLAPLVLDDMTTITESSGRMVGLLRKKVR